ncbi:MAG: Tol-Pal system beta propeller repeat protein TolB [Rickettsiella sp.]|nr:Tol-Pal system beta propeller repeat protein TolB [Rickettsiella sp.]
MPAHAALNLELTQGVSNQLPIAIVPFAGSNHLDESNDVSTIIKNDLNRSGQFKTSVSPSATPISLNQITTSDWRKQHIDDVVVGQIKALDNARYRVQFSLVNVVQAQRHTLLQQEFTVNKNQLRRLAHHISDLIYEKLTGIKGNFSTRIAYILVTDKNSLDRHYSLQVADMDGYNSKPLLTSTQPIMSPAWSRDGKRIAYVSFEKVLPRIYIQNVSTGERELISSFPGINGAPAWSPNDKTLALALSKDAAAPKIYLMDLITKKLRQITFGLSIDTEPSFSQDGRSLLFTSDRSGGPQIYRINLHSGHIQRMTYDGNYNARASFSNDGKTIVVLNQEQGSYNIAVQDVADNSLKILTHSGYDASPSFAPNGQLVLYESKPGRQGLLGMVSVDGRITLRLPTPQGDVQDPTWSPFLS